MTNHFPTYMKASYGRWVNCTCGWSWAPAGYGAVIDCMIGHRRHVANMAVIEAVNRIEAIG